MNDTTVLLMGVLIGLGYVLAYFLGSVIAKLNASSENDNTAKPVGFLNKTNKKHQGITIDSKTYVTDIKTDQFEKSFKDLGDTTVDQDTVSESVSKLNQLKRK